MQILKEVIRNNRRHIYYLTDQPSMKGYVFQLMSTAKDHKDLSFKGMVCSLPVWERTFNRFV